MSIFGFGAGVNIDVNLTPGEAGVTRTVKGQEGQPDQDLQVYTGDEAITGEIVLRTAPGKRVEHLGIKVEMMGQIEMFYDRGNHYEFASLVRELEPAGTLAGETSYPFDFSSVEKPHESYDGLNVRLRYFVKVTITRNYNSNIVKEQDFIVVNLDSEPEMNNSIKMEVGIEDCLHIEFEYDKQKYHLEDILLGKIFFLLVRIKIKHMELAIIRRESAGSGSNIYNESETLTKFELMDGAPVRGESIPIRLFLKGFNSLNLTPTFRSINNRFSVKYYVNLVLVDEEDRRYFKQQEITLWRRDVS